MSQGPVTPDDDDFDPRSRPERLAAYYALLLLFLYLASKLLQTVGSLYNLQQFEKLHEIVKLALNPAARLDDVAHTVFSLFFAFVFVLPLAWVYTLTKDNERFDPSLVQTLILLGMAVTGMMIVIGTELARAFSLAGVVAAIRFRNTLDDVKDTVYVFVAIAIGMACGARAYYIAVWLSMVMCATMYFLWKARFGRMVQESSGTLHKQGKGKKPESLQWLRDDSAEGVARHSLEQQVRLLQWASAPSKTEGKRLNAAVVVAANDLGLAQKHVDAKLALFGGKWKLAGITSDGEGGGGVLEYLGRTPKEATAAALVAALCKDAPPAVAGIEYRSLKGLRPPAAAGAAPGAAALPPARRVEEDD
jgi:hypothetical protein